MPVTSKACCPNCGSTNIEQYDASGASICTECAVVVEENAIVSSVDFVEGAGGSAQMVGKLVSATSSRAFTGVERGWGFSRDSRETTLANGKRRIQEVAARLRLGNRYIDAAHRLFTIAVEKNFVQGRRTMHVVAACLYIACRQEKSQHMLIDFSDALQVNVYTLGTCFLKFRRLLGLQLEIIDPALYVYRFAAHLDLSDKANAVALTALRLVGRMKRDWIVAGRRPAGICAAALLIAARAHGFSRHPQDVTRILRVCGLTVSTRVREFEQTPSASLTLDQFNKVELENQADPPIYTRNRIREARARAIQKNDVELLTSGVLDDPMARRSAAKWRQPKTKAKDEEMENLYKSLEEEMKSEMKKMQAEAAADENGEGQQQGEEEKDEDNDETKEKEDENLSKEQDGSGDDGSNNDRSSAEALAVTAMKKQMYGEKSVTFAASSTNDEKDADGSEKEYNPGKDQRQQEDDGEDDDDDLHKKPKATPLNKDGEGDNENDDNNDLPVSILKKGNDTETALASSTSLAFSKSVTIMDGQLSTIPKKWVDAYPKSKHGKAIVLPDESTPEERLPSSIPVEGRLETKFFKDKMPDSMIEDIESIFRTPTEIAQKEAIFNKINKDYIELQAQKDKVRRTAAKQQSQDELDMQEQEKSHERYRKKRGRPVAPGETTKDALLEAVSNRKISRKINYDAMSAIFDDDGGFSTAAEADSGATLPQTEEEVSAFF